MRIPLYMDTTCGREKCSASYPIMRIRASMTVILMSISTRQITLTHVPCMPLIGQDMTVPVYTIGDGNRSFPGMDP